MPNIRGVGGFKPLSVSKKQEVLSALRNPKAISFQQIANHTGVAKSTVIKLNKLHKIRPQGNFFSIRSIKQPTKSHLRRTRIIGLEGFIRECAVRGVPVSVNLLQKRFGGEKKTIKSVLDSQTRLLSRGGLVVLRRTKSSQPKRLTQK